MNMEFRVNSCEIFTDILKISFVPQFVNSRYEMCREMGVLLIHCIKK